jgi:hypothetical protein
MKWLRSLRKRPRKPVIQRNSLWRAIEDKVYLGPVISASEWGTILQTVADELEKHVVKDAGPPIGIYFEESPVQWLRNEAAKARKGAW